jgi:hypothetical protein
LRNLPLSSPSKKKDSSIRILQARNVLITRLCAGAPLAVTRAVLIGLSSSGNEDWMLCNDFKKRLNGPDFNSILAETLVFFFHWSINTYVCNKL